MLQFEKSLSHTEQIVFKFNQKSKRNGSQHTFVIKDFSTRKKVNERE